MAALSFSSYDAGMTVEAIPPVQHYREDGVARTTIEIPRRWLMTSLDASDVERVQRDDTEIDLGADRLTLTGIELVIQRCWFREGHWLEVRQAITQGYIHHKTWVELVLRGDRRHRPSGHPGGLSPRVRFESDWLPGHE